MPGNKAFNNERIMMPFAAITVSKKLPGWASLSLKPQRCSEIAHLISSDLISSELDWREFTTVPFVSFQSGWNGMRWNEWCELQVFGKAKLGWVVTLEQSGRVKHAGRAADQQQTDTCCLFAVGTGVESVLKVWVDGHRRRPSTSF